MSSEIEITVRVMTPRPGQDPLYTAEKFLHVGEASDPKFQWEVVRDFNVLLGRAVNAVVQEKIAAAEAKSIVARAKDQAEYENDTRMEF